MIHVSPMARHRDKIAPSSGLRDGRLDRRVAQRFFFDWEVRIRGIGLTGFNFNERGESNNLSSSGLLLNLKKSLKPGTRLEVWLKAPYKKKNWIIYSGETARVQSALQRVGVAVRFDTPHPRFSSSYFN